MVILDTNVLSELMATRPSESVQAWANAQRRDQLVTTVITVMELYSGVNLMKPSRRRGELETLIERALDDLLGGRVLTFDRRAAIATAEWYATQRRSGSISDIRDTQIAGIALARRIPIATRNVDHFEGLGVKVINPWAFLA